MPVNYDPPTMGEEDLLLRAGASPEFIAVLKAHPGAGQRHSIREHALGRLREFDDPEPHEVRDRIVETGGGFFTKLWRGRLFDAFLQADSTNSKLMLDVFSREFIIARGVAGSRDADYVHRIVNGRVDSLRGR